MKPKWLSYKLLLQLLGIGIFIVFILSIDLQDLSDVASLLNVTIVSIILLLIFLNLIIKGLRWQYLVKLYSGVHMSLGLATGSVVAGVAAGSILPGRFDAAKPLLLKNTYDIPLSEGVSAMMVERIFDLLTLVFLFFLSAAFLFHEISNSAIAFYSLVLVIVFFTILFILLLFFPMIVNRIAVSLINRLPIQSNRKQKFSAVIQKFFQSIQKVHSSKALTVIFLFSIIATTLEVLRLFVIFDHIGAEKSFILLTFGLSMGMLVGLAALIPGGIGVSEVTESKVIDTLNGTDTSTSVTSSAVLIDRLFAYYFLVLLGSLILLFSKKLFIPIHETGEDDTKEDDETREDEGSAEST